MVALLFHRCLRRVLALALVFLAVSGAEAARMDCPTAALTTCASTGSKADDTTPDAALTGTTSTSPAKTSPTPRPTTTSRAAGAADPIPEAEDLVVQDLNAASAADPSTEGSLTRFILAFVGIVVVGGIPLLAYLWRRF